MKTAKIIKKNIKLLLRSRVSTLVLTLGPLIVILLVGISFSSNTFSLNLGVYSEKYSELSNQFIENLTSEGYRTIKYPSEERCIESVKEGLSHACISFPSDLQINPESNNVIKFFVDQSRINLVYLVESTLKKSFGAKTTEISRELTSDILETLADAESRLESSSTALSEMDRLTGQMSTDVDYSINKLDNIDLDSGTELNLELEASDIRNELSSLASHIAELVDSSLEYLDDVEDYVSGNGTAYLDDLRTTVYKINDSASDGQNTTLVELNSLLSKVGNDLEEITDKLNDAKDANVQVVNKLKSLKQNSKSLQDKVTLLDRDINVIVSRIGNLEITDAGRISAPISTEINKIVRSESNLGFLFPTLIVILIMYIGLFLPSTLIIMEKNSKAYFRIFTTPTKSSLFVYATYLTTMILITFQIFIILLVSQFYFKINFMTSITMLGITLVLIMSFFTLIGMLIGYLFNSEEMAMLAGVTLGTLFLLTSGLIFPLESMPDYIIDKAKFNPVVLSSEVFKRTLLFNSDFNSIKSSLGYLVLFSLIIVLMIFVIKKSNTLQFILKKPSKMKIKKDNLIKQFDFGERKAKTLPEFIVSLQNMTEEKFHTLAEQHAFRDWLLIINKNRYLATKVDGLKNQKEIIDLLAENLKKIEEKKTESKK